MKYCIHCGQKINDDETFCSKCGKRQSTESNEGNLINQNITKKDENKPEISLNAKLITRIVGVVLTMPGVILFLVFVIKEFSFKTNYDLSKLSETGINLLRETTGNDLNVAMIIVGLILMVVGVLISSMPQILKWNAERETTKK